MKTIKEIIECTKIECKDIPLDDARYLDFDTLQIKYDGWWTLVHLHDRIAEIWSSGGRLLNTIPSPDFTGTAFLIAEYMYGTNWAQSHDPGTLWVHDIYQRDNQTYEDTFYYHRQTVIFHLLDELPAEFKPVRNYDMKELSKVWSMVNEQEFEGVVYKHSLRNMDDRFGRTKRKFTADYVIMGFEEGKGKHAGRLGSIHCGLYVNGELKHICSIGGGYSDAERIQFWQERESLVGKVLEAWGLGLFPGGALRHSQFSRFRDDKQPEDCRL